MKIIQEITFNKLVSFCKKKKSLKYYAVVTRFKEYFSGDVKIDVRLANKLIDSTSNNNTANAYCTVFKFAYNLFYGMAFNPKYIHHRSSEISKTTTRLDVNQIEYVNKKFQEWINLNIHNSPIQENTKIARTKIYFAFKALLNSGMRIGELCSIKWYKNTASRFITSQIDKRAYAEIIINTEKTCKKREIYIEKLIYEWFCQHIRYRLKKGLIVEGFCVFKKWAHFEFKWSAHSLRRTKASLMHEVNVDVPSIAQVLGNTVRTCMNHYILGSPRNFDACDIANCLMNGSVKKFNNLFLNNNYLTKE